MLIYRDYGRTQGLEEFDHVYTISMSSMDSWVMIAQVFMISDGTNSISSNCWFNMSLLWERLLPEEYVAGLMSDVAIVREPRAGEVFGGPLSGLPLRNYFNRYWN